MLDDPLSSSPTFVASDVAVTADLDFSLTVFDSNGAGSAAATTRVTVRDVNAPPSCSNARPNIDELWPPNATGLLQPAYILNDGTGTFTDASAQRIPADADATLAVGLGDVDGDGDLDLVAANYPSFSSRGPSRLYLNLLRTSRCRRSARSSSIPPSWWRCHRWWCRSRPV